MILGILFFSLIAIAGFVGLLKGASNRFYWSEVKGDIVGFHEYFNWSSPQSDDGPSSVRYIPIVQFTVKGNKYSGKPRHNMAWNEPDYSKEVIVLYNPANPEDFYLKDGTMLGGCVLFVIGIIAILIIIVLNLKH